MYFSDMPASRASHIYRVIMVVAPLNLIGLYRVYKRCTKFYIYIVYSTLIQAAHYRGKNGVQKQDILTFFAFNDT